MVKRALITAEVHPFLQLALEAKGWQVDVFTDIDADYLKEIITNYSILIVTTYLQVNKSIIDAAKNLKIVGRVGSGMENIDVAYCKEKNIACLNSPEGNANAVGEHALSLLLCLYNKIGVGQNDLKMGNFFREENRGEEITGKTVGIIGFGNTGSVFAKKLSGFDVRILAYDKYKKINDDQIQQTDLRTVQQEADVISFHVPYTPETHHYCDIQFLENCKLHPTIINTSRGAVVDTLAIIKQLNEHKIFGYCVDVFEDEPLTKNKVHPIEVYQQLLSFTNVVATPHVAGWTHQSKLKLVEVLWHKMEQEILIRS